MKHMILAGLSVMALGSAGLSACATISEDKCIAGNWQELGYRDGSNGVKRDKASKIADTCAKYGVEMNFDAYLAGFNQGLPNYCTYERGYERGTNGSSYNQACSGEFAADFAPGYDTGRAVYAEHKSLVSRYESKLDDVAGTQARLDTEDLAEGDRKRLIKKLRRFTRQAENMEIELDDWEERHDLSCHRF